MGPRSSTTAALCNFRMTKPVFFRMTQENKMDYFDFDFVGLSLVSCMGPRFHTTAALCNFRMTNPVIFRIAVGMRMTYFT